MSEVLAAAAPDRNAVVAASAGTGKTWLLVTRIMRLLLAGVAPENILALTFTRKAAAEMASRLRARLLELSLADDAHLDELLGTLGVTSDPALRDRARRLHETLLYAVHPIRIGTFHAFCQELLRRFPLEADVPPAFELLEATGMLEDEAWDALYAEATAQPDGALAQALEALFANCGGLFNTHAALRAFVAHRGDWWAYSMDAADAVAHALARVIEQLEFDPTVDEVAGFFTSSNLADLGEFARLLARHPTATNTRHAAQLAGALDIGVAVELRLEAVRGTLLRSDGQPRVRKASAAQRAALGADGEQRLLALHDALCERLRRLDELRARRRTCAISSAWYRAGTRLLEHFQRIKLERRALDFTDLEWKAYCLLNHAEHAQWVQYKLDQRIEHLLVDEFQDTNPVQWRLLLPLLQELAAATPERPRSVFLVGDVKQSIYRFRRAEPRLMDTCAHWLEAHLQAGTHTMDMSRRSAPAIVAFVNRVFEDGPLHERLATFRTHTTVHAGLWGRVELLPLVVDRGAEETDETPELRDPLRTPRVVPEDLRHYEEGRMIAARIAALRAQPAMVGTGADALALDYNDVVILLRSRTHAHAYERALRDAGIPFIGAERGTLLESLEVRDLIALLETLIAPYDNLALAQVLRSPLFAAGDEDLARLARGSGPWMERLAQEAAAAAAQTPLERAHRWLSRWGGLAGRVPVHDLLDHIYSEGDVRARYEAAFPPALVARVHANLVRFMELALEVDSGRYPSLPYFLQQLRLLRARDQDAPDEAPSADSEQRVRLLTIHAAKGLEAPAVFLADAAASRRNQRPYRPLVEWPPDADRPTHFLLLGRSGERDDISAALVQRQDAQDLREETNLLYVALTRAKQLLFVSGAAPTHGDDCGWYGAIAERCADFAVPTEAGGLLIESGAPVSAASGRAPRARPAPEIDPRLARPFTPRIATVEIAPSRTVEGVTTTARIDEDALRRGIAIHRMLELLTTMPPADSNTIPLRVADELGMARTDYELQEWWQEARALPGVPELRPLFDRERYRAAHNEVPVQYLEDDRLVYGIIDRLLVSDDELVVIDYKTHRAAAFEPLPALASPYTGQMRLYARGARALWPGRPVRALLLFTARPALYAVPLEEGE